ncbi:surface protein [Ruminococcaceae bacterium YAD3003]|nr:surface protein [Ruminococcaceae bacterium YAD3003]
MRNTLERIKRHSKKGTTLVELVVAMTLTLIFAVVCVALINPIERTYQNVEKMSRAQLLADTIIDSIRKECDDVQYDDPNAVWLVAAGNSADDDQMLFAVPSGKPASGNVLVIKKDNKYCEAIYSCFPISSQNISNLTANPADGSTSAHAASTLTGDNLNRGLVHFGYYQGKYSKDGLYPFKAYDYTNPVTASTYGDYTVALLFERVGCKTINGVEYPAFVECTVKVYKGDYNNGGEFIYSRTAAVCFSANGSAQGSAGNIDTSSTTHVRDYNVVIEWDDGNAADRPASVVVKLCDDLNDLDPSNDVVLRTHTLDTTKTRFVFADVKTTGKAYIIVPDFPGYTTMGPISRSDGFYVKYQRSDSAKLIRGIELRNKMSKQVTNVIFGLKSDPVLAEAIKNASHSEPVALNGDEISDRYMLYIVEGTDDEGNPKKTAYILSDDPEIVLNEDSSQMFMDCDQLKQITGLDMLNTSSVIDMHRMFYNCKSLAMTNLVLPWDTSNVETMDSMFRNVCCTVDDDVKMTIDISSFTFDNCHYYYNGNNNGVRQINGINKMFCNDVSDKSHIETIIFPAGHKNMSKLTKLQDVFNGCESLVNLVNFNDIDFSGLREIDESEVTYSYQAHDLAIVGLFINCSSLKELDLSDWYCPNITNVNGMFVNLKENKTVGPTNLIKLDMSGLNLSGCSSVNNMLSGAKSLKEIDLSDSNLSGVTELGIFKGKTTLTKVDLSGCTSGITSVAGMFYNCSNLETVDLTGVINSNITSIASVFEGCNKLKNICLDGCVTSNVTDMSYAFKNCHTNTADNFEISLAGIDFSNVVNMTEMFNGTGASVITFPNDANFSKVENIDGLFRNCKGLTTINGFQNVEFPLVTDASYLFGGCSKLESADFDMRFAIVENISNMFSGCTSLSSVDLTMDFPEVTNASSLFSGCTGLANVTLDIDFPKVSSVDGLFQGCTGLTTVDLTIDADSATSAKYLFSGCTNLTNISLDADLPSVEDISYMFSGCSSLKTADVDLKFANVTKADNLFNNCNNLETVKADFILPKVSSISNMFTNCTKLSSIDSNMSFGKVSNINNMFKGCTSLSTVDLSLSVPEATTANYLFSGCTNLKSIALDADFPNVTDISYMFNGCTNLSTVTADLDYPNVKNATSLFTGCKSLKAIPNVLNLPNATDINYMFKDCISLQKVEKDLYFPNALNALGLFQGCTGLKEVKSKMTLPNIESLYYTFKSCTSLESVDLSNSSFDYVDSLNSMFEGCSSLKKVTMEHVNLMSVTRYNNVFKDCSKLEIIDMSYIDLRNATKDNLGFLKVANLKELYLDHANLAGVTTFYQWLYNKQTIKIVDFSGADLSECTSVELMFGNCQKLEEAYFYDVTLPKCKSAKKMFQVCYHLKVVKMNNFVTPINENCSSMFESCQSLTVFEAAGWDTGRVTNMGNMFKNACYNDGTHCISTDKVIIDLSSFDFTSVTNLTGFFTCTNPGSADKDRIEGLIFPSVSKGGDPYAQNIVEMNGMFQYRKNMKSISNFGEFRINLANLTKMEYIFSNTGLIEIDISGLDFTGCTLNAQGMFQSCANLTTIYAAPGTDWSQVSFSNTNNMFQNDTKLVGKDITGNHPDFAFTSGSIKKDYARINGLDGKNGYFTEKSA